MKRLNFILISILMLGSVAFAQNQVQKEKVNPQEKAEQVTKRMAKKLLLNEEQTKKVKVINQDYFDRMAIKNTDMKQMSMKRQLADSCMKVARIEKAELKEMRVQRMAVKKEYDDKIREVLTEDQYKAYQQQEQKTDRKGDMPHRKVGVEGRNK